MDEIERLTEEVTELRKRLAETWKGWAVLAERFGAPHPRFIEAAPRGGLDDG